MDRTFLQGYLGLGLCIGGHVLAGSAMGGLFGPGEGPVTWLDTLKKPGLYPPGWTFGVVWTILYAMMGVAVWLVLRAGDGPALRAALGVYAVHFVVNMAFSPLFFGLQSPLWGMVDVAALWLLLPAVMLLFRNIAPPAAALLLPYYLWVTFALYLSVSLWRLNPDA